MMTQGWFCGHVASLALKIRRGPYISAFIRKTHYWYPLHLFWQMYYLCCLAQPRWDHDLSGFCFCPCQAELPMQAILRYGTGKGQSVQWSNRNASTRKFYNEKNGWLGGNTELEMALINWHVHEFQIRANACCVSEDGPLVDWLVHGHRYWCRNITGLCHESVILEKFTSMMIIRTLFSRELF